MQVGTKEFYDLMNQFEKDLKNMNVYGCRIQREPLKMGEKNVYFYTDGRVNGLFEAYMFGYSNAKCIFNNQ